VNQVSRITFSFPCLHAFYVIRMVVVLSGSCHGTEGVGDRLQWRRGEELASETS